MKRRIFICIWQSIEWYTILGLIGFLWLFTGLYNKNFIDFFAFLSQSGMIATSMYAGRIFQKKMIGICIMHTYTHTCGFEIVWTVQFVAMHSYTCHFDEFIFIVLCTPGSERADKNKTKKKIWFFGKNDISTKMDFCY